VVAFIEDGNLRLWDEATGEAGTLVDTGDVIAVTMSADGQVVAFVRRSVVSRSDTDWFEQSALWAVDPDGGNARELVSAEALRTALNASETDSTNFPQLEWIPGTHRLLYSGWRYFVLAEGESHAIPEGLFVVDTDSGADTTIVPAGRNVRFSPSPDGEQVALLSPTSLGFVNSDGSGLRPDVLTFGQAGAPGPLFPVGVWTQDSSAFLITGSFDWEPASGTNFTIWRVPADGSPADSLADIRRSHPGSVAFSPDGRQVAAIQYSDDVPPQIAGWFITPLAAEVGPVAIPDEVEVGYANVHWSPAGDPFTGALLQLCPDAARETDICGGPISFAGFTTAVSWVDGSTALLLTREPSVLFLVRMDGTTRPIAAWPLEDWVGPASFAAAKLDP
jgi:dipeptidyl aminopeptidase/acylaminoacyl peptidase